MAKKVDPATAAWLEAIDKTFAHPLFESFKWDTRVERGGPDFPGNLCAYVSQNGYIICHPTRRLEVAEWCWVLGHCCLHLGMGHHREHSHADLWNQACDEAVARLLAALKWGRPVAEYPEIPTQAASNEDTRYAELVRLKQGTSAPRDIVFGQSYRHTPRWSAMLAHGIRQAVHSAMARAGGVEVKKGVPRLTPIQQARDWFMASYPLLGSLAASFEIVEDSSICKAQGVDIAAVNYGERRIYLNAAVPLQPDEIRFIMAHEFLHAGLSHGARSGGRDAYLWNVACDFVINGWLIEMGVGQPPQLGLLHDPELKGLSAEEVYERIVIDARIWRKRGTFAGIGQGDILQPKEGNFTDLDDFYRRCLARGWELHKSLDRGFLPGGLAEAIQALEQPPIPWDVDLARWFDRYFPPVEKTRTYARPSRRQQATPEVPRPSRSNPADWLDARTFAVVLDTSGSISRENLAKALGAIAAYAQSRDVPAVRLICCDAHAYDEGYLPAEAIAGRVRLKGRGGTVLQPALELLETADDFPDSGPILIITDGACDRLTVRGSRAHAYLMTVHGALPFVPRGPVFRMED